MKIIKKLTKVTLYHLGHANYFYMSTETLSEIHKIVDMGPTVFVFDDEYSEALDQQGNRYLTKKDVPETISVFLNNVSMIHAVNVEMPVEGKK